MYVMTTYSTKQAVLLALQSSPTVLSGEYLAKQLGVSRTAIWKAIKQLQAEQYSILTSSNGYQLLKTDDILNVATIRQLLPDELQSWEFEYYSSISSTNDMAKQYAITHAHQPKVFLANEQTAGRGRMGKQFFSPANTGIYMSICVFPTTPLHDVSMITCATAIAAARALEEFTHQRIGIKWVNDLYLHQKKIGGILTEGITSVENHSLASLIVGIGINISPSDHLPDQLKDIASSVFDAPAAHFTRNEWIARFLTHWNELFHTLNEKTFMEEYKKRSIVLGKPITVHRQGKIFHAIARDITPEGHLLVEDEQNALHELTYGEVSIRTI